MIKGFIVSDHDDRFPAFLKEVRAARARGPHQVSRGHRRRPRGRAVRAHRPVRGEELRQDAGPGVAGPDRPPGSDARPNQDASRSRVKALRASMDTFIKDLPYAVPRACGRTSASPRSRPSRSRSASAPARRSSASSTPSCCGRCRIRTRAAGVRLGRAARAQRPATGRSRRRTSAICACSPRRCSRTSPGIIPAGRTPISDAGGEPEQIRVGAATPNFFRLLGARVLARPRFHRRRCDAAAAAAAAGRRRAGGSAAGRSSCRRSRSSATASGSAATAATRQSSARTVDLGDSRAQIVGVLAPGFELLFPPRVNVERVPDMWTAARFNFETANRNNVAFRVIGRLKPGRDGGAGADAGRSRRGRPPAAVPDQADSRASTSTSCRCSTIWSAACVRRSCR